MRSGRGFRNDLAALRDGVDEVTQPTLVIAGRNDGSVPFAHASAIQRGDLIEGSADGHFMVLSHDWRAISGKIRDFVVA